MSEIVVNKSAIEKFVRQSLGCSCPPEVFDIINVEHNPVAYGKVQPGYLLIIGGRLLVYVIEIKDWKSYEGKLEQIFNWGREKRDTGGFNRFRLVVATSDIEAARQKLLQQFDSLFVSDKRLHLHVIAPDCLPGT